MLKAPFPYFGGKRSIAPKVWELLGDPGYYIEPFFGSGAVLLNRPNFEQDKHIELICDLDGYVCNVWRAIKADPDKVAEYCDWPVNHADLIARKKRLIEEEPNLLEALCKDDEYFNPKIAGYWIWAASCWIGSGLTCKGQIPDVSKSGVGVHSKGKIPKLGRCTGVHAKGKIPLLDWLPGVHAKGQIPQVGTTEKGVATLKNNNIYEWFQKLSERLRYVRVVCGDWSRVCGGNWQTSLGICGIFFDPPYSGEDMSEVYQHDSSTVAIKVADWALERGKSPEYRIVLAGYYEEHERLLNEGWGVHRWTRQGGYDNIGGTNDSRHKESLFYSPHCIQPMKDQQKYFDIGEPIPFPVIAKDRREMNERFGFPPDSPLTSPKNGVD